MIVIQPTKRRYRSTRRKESREDALTKLKAEVVRLGCNGTRQGFKFAQQLMKALPELKNA